MNQPPLVSVICLCHNHVDFLTEAIQSVWAQSYPNIELIVVDDGSTDGSKAAINQLLDGRNTAFIDIPDSIGNCAAFNKGFQQSKGAFVVDLAADDVLLPERISKGYQSLSDGHADVSFCDVMLIDASGRKLRSHYRRNTNGQLVEHVPQGDLYLKLIQRYFISPPSMMMSRKVLETLEGYDASLDYEDFDFWIRSSRDHRYVFTDAILVNKRELPDSLGKKQFGYRTRYQATTLKVCQKIKALNRSREENLALRKRCFYEIRQCLRQGNFRLIPAFMQLL